MTRSSIREKVLVYGGYSSFFSVAFVICAYFTFPYDKARDFIVSKVSDNGGPDALTLSIGDLRPSWLTGVSLEDVSLSRPAATADAPATNLHFDRISARASLFSLLLGSRNLSIDAEVGAGSLSAKVGQDSEGQHIDAELTDLDLQQLGLGSFVGAPLKGTASGTVSLVLPDDALKSSGNIELKVAGLHLGDGKAKIKAPGMPSGLTLDEVDAGTFELALQTQEGVSTLSRFSSNGRDLKVSGSGTVRLGNPLRLSRPDLILELKFSDTYKNKSDRTKSLFEILGLQPEWRRALGPDGALRLRLGGILGALRVAPSAVGPATPGHGKGKAHTR